MVIIIDEGDPGYVQTGGWLPGPGGHGGTRRYRPGTEVDSKASWTMTAPASGYWTYAVDWSENGAPDVTYEVRKNGTTIATHVVDQGPPSVGDAPAGDLAFCVLGGTTLAAGDTLQVELQGLASGYIHADACRFEQTGPGEPASLSLSAATVVAGRSKTIHATGTGTSWTNATQFIVLGGEGASIASTVVESPTSASFTLASGRAAGTLAITDGSAKAAIEVTEAPPAMITLAPTSATAGTPVTITATGTNTDFGGPGQASATVSGGDGAAISGFSAISPTSATFTLVPGKAAGTLTVSIGSANASITVDPAPSVPQIGPANGYEVILPSSLMVGQTATAVVVLKGGVGLAAPLVVTLADAEANMAGTVTIAEGSTYGTTTFTPTTSGTHRVTANHSGGNAGMSDPSPASVSVIKPISGEPGSAPTLDQIQAACAAALAATPVKVGTILDKAEFGLSAAERAAIAAEVEARISLIASITSLDAIASKIADTPMAVKDGGITASSFAPGAAVPLPATPPSGYGGSSLTTAQVQQACAAAIVATPATVGTVQDKTGYVLAASGLDAIVVEAGINARQALSPILAALAGTISGAGTGVINIKGGNSATTRITAITDNAGNRSSIQLNLPG